jgi:hypothetical protein
MNALLEAYKIVALLADQRGAVKDAPRADVAFAARASRGFFHCALSMLEVK